MAGISHTPVATLMPSDLAPIAVAPTVRPMKTPYQPAQPQPSAHPTHTPTVRSPDRPVGSVIAIGDSVMEGAIPELRADIPGIVINAVESRQVAAGIDVLERWQPRTALLDTVVIHLGTNGTFTMGQFATIMHLLAKTQRVVFVNDHMDRPWELSNNAIIANGVAHYPNTRLVNWYALSTTAPNVFWSDGIHLRPTGAVFYAHLIAQAVYGP